MTVTELLLLLIAAAVLPVVMSQAVEALRKAPEPPAKLYWDAAVPIQYVSIDNIQIRYIQTGQGPILVLLHTLRTQLDIFQKMIPELSKNFTVYALDYPGHGFSGIVKTNYVPGLFVTTVEKFLEKMNISNATLAGISIGGTIPLLIAANHNPRVKRVIAINPYDYAKGRGIQRGNFVARLIFTLARIPIIGETVMRFRNSIVETAILKGGVAVAEAWPQELLQQIYAAGLRKEHYRAFINLIRHLHEWENVHHLYSQIAIPVLLIYGERDWSTSGERERTLKAIPGAKLETVKEGGHFLSVDQPQRLTELVKKFASG